MWVVYEKHPTKKSHQYYIESCNGMVAPCRVRIECPGMKPKTGTLKTWLAGWGPSPRPIIGFVTVDPTPSLLEASAKTLGGIQPIQRHYRAEHLSPA